MQYERWQSRAKYKQCLDPTLEDVKKLCSSLRRNARRERVLFHYNVHASVCRVRCAVCGVPCAVCGVPCVCVCV